MASQNALNQVRLATAERTVFNAAPTGIVCPGCTGTISLPLIEEYGNYKLFACDCCGLQSWEPREMPDARWYEQMYGGRDEKLLPLEPGHRYFLTDPQAPRAGNILDIGCGTGNFLAAARDSGYDVTGIELDRKAARFAKEHLGLQNIFPLAISEFVKQCAGERFDVVTFFEVLEHQATPVEFLRNVVNCLKSGGVIALSVPNRERWQTGPDVLDYPPNHFLRWNAAALRRFLGIHGFEVLSMHEQPAGLAYTAQMMNMALRTGVLQRTGKVASFRDVIQMSPEQAEAALHAKKSARQRAIEILGRIKHFACWPLAAAAYPYVRWRGFKGTYLYCLARKHD